MTSKFHWEPAVWSQAINLVIAALVAFHVLTGTTCGAIGTLAAGLVAVVTAILTRPWAVAAFTGAVQAVLTGVVLLGAHISDTQQAAIIAVIAFAIGLITRTHVTPAVKTKADAGLAA